MRTLLSVAFVIAACSSAAAQELSAEEAKEGFVSMFNGKDFSGWRFPTAEMPKNWSVAEGMIRLSGGGSPNLGTQWPYADFDMRFQWRPMKKGYNSGFYVRSGRNVGANQINLAEGDCGHLMGGAKGGDKVPHLQKPPGEWNDWRVLAEGDKLTFWCNGKEAWSVTGFKPADGHLGFQAEGAAIDFRNLRIREIGFKHVDLKGDGWKAEGDALVAGNGAKSITIPASPVVRLEFQSKSGGLALGKSDEPAVSFGAEPISKLLNPEGQWNYLQLKFTGEKGSVWLNGSDLKVGVDGGGPVRFIAGSDAKLRNIRIRETK